MWVEWYNGSCPVPLDTRVDVAYQSGHTAWDVIAGDCDWTNFGRIIAYRVIQ